MLYERICYKNHNTFETYNLIGGTICGKLNFNLNIDF